MWTDEVWNQIFFRLNVVHRWAKSKIRKGLGFPFLMGRGVNFSYQGPLHLNTPNMLISLIFIDLGDFYWFQGAHGKIYWFQPPTAVGAHRRLKMLISYQYFCTKSIKMDLKSIILVAPMAKILIWGCTQEAPTAMGGWNQYTTLLSIIQWLNSLSKGFE